MNPFELPLFVPALLVAIACAVAGADRVARATGASRLVGMLVIIAFGVVVAATLTPQASAFQGGVGSGTCDMTRLQPADLPEYLRVGETLGNVLLFVPLGFMLALLPPSRVRTGLLALAIVLPFVVEGLQLSLPAVDRACQGADLVDNLLGLGIGLALGALAGWVIRRTRRPGHPDPDGADAPASQPPAPR
jgi:hypothetical protein